jgi:hypothetical protein
MHTDPQSLVDVWSRRNLGLGIPPKWLIFLRSLGDSNPCFRRERASCIPILISRRRAASAAWPCGTVSTRTYSQIRCFFSLMT